MDAGMLGAELRRGLCRLMAVAAFALALPASAVEFGTGTQIAQPGLRGGPGTGARFNVPVKSLSEMRWDGVVRQQIEVGCGAAALATILTHYFDFPTTEEEMFFPLLEESQKRSSGPTVVEAGFSLYEIRQVAARGGFAAAAFRVKPEEIEKVRIPVITRITVHGFDHFVVLREARAGRVFVADPFYGNTSYRLGKFGDMWSGVVMGFARRNQKRPLDHALEVGPEDQWRIDSEEIARLAFRDAIPTGVRGLMPPRYTRIDMFDFISPQIPGLRSALPSLLTRSIEF